MIFFKEMHQNDTFLRSLGPLKISFVHRYEVHWIHNIDPICKEKCFLLYLPLRYAMGRVQTQSETRLMDKMHWMTPLYFATICTSAILIYHLTNIASKIARVIQILNHDR